MKKFPVEIDISRSKLIPPTSVLSGTVRIVSEKRTGSRVSFLRNLTENLLTTIFADTEIVSSNSSPNRSSEKFHHHLNVLEF